MREATASALPGKMAALGRLAWIIAESRPTIEIRIARRSQCGRVGRVARAA